jgi:putative PIN family toxin of toxin-antitoxin system
MTIPVVLDTNVIVAAGFQPGGAAGRLLDAIREGALRLVWDDATRRETERTVRRIPPLARMPIEELYRPEDRYEGVTDPAAFAFVEDPDDRKFLALAAASGAVLITLDEHLLGVREQTGVRILTPREFRDLPSAPPGSDTPPPR